MPADMRGRDESTSTAIPKDLCKAFDRRLKHFTFTAISPRLDEWKGSQIVNAVFDDEYNIKHFKSSEEQILWRLETWIDKCRITKYDENGDPVNNGTGKFHSAKRFRKSEGGLAKARSFSLGRAFSKSTDNLHHKRQVNLEIAKSQDKLDDEFFIIKELRPGARIATSKSTNNLLDVDRPLRDPSLDRQSTKSMDIPVKPSLSSKPKLNRFFAIAGRLRPNKSNKENKKNKNLNYRYSAEYEIDEEPKENNNTPVYLSKNKTRPSVLDVAGIFETKDNTESEKKTNSIVTRSASTAAEYQHSQTLFKARNHNDSMKRLKVKVQKASHPSVTGFNGSVFYDPEIPEAPIRTDICDL